MSEDAVSFRRMSQLRELGAEIINREGRPLVRWIHWRGETRSAPPGKLLKALLVCLIGRGNNWTNVWIALFPAGVEGAEEIKVVVSSKAVRDEVLFWQAA